MILSTAVSAGDDWAERVAGLSVPAALFERVVEARPQKNPAPTAVKNRAAQTTRVPTLESRTPPRDEPMSRPLQQTDHCLRSFVRSVQRSLRSSLLQYTGRWSTLQQTHRSSWGRTWSGSALRGGPTSCRSPVLDSPFWVVRGLRSVSGSLVSRCSLIVVKLVIKW